MARETYYLGPSPCEEDCVQVKTGENYLPAMKAEVDRFIRQIKRAYGDPPPGAQLMRKGENHDFGTYYEAIVLFDPNNEEASEYASIVEEDPDKRLVRWDDAA